MDDSVTSEDSGVEVIEWVIEPLDEDSLSGLIVDIGESEELAGESARNALVPAPD